MSENQNRGIRDFSKYDAMTTEELEEILRLDAAAPEGGESDTELLLYVMEVLVNRRNNANITGKTALESWESFQQRYLPGEEACLEDTSGRKPGKTSPGWLGRLIAAAAVVVLIVCIPVAANAFGWGDMWQAVARWAKETFSFVSSEDAVVSEPSPDYEGECTSLRELLEKNEIDTDIIPTWIPDGYVVEKVVKDVSPQQEVYVAYYVDAERELFVRCQDHISTDLQNMEIEESIIEVYESSGIEYYIFENMDQLQVMWVKDSYECNIFGDLSLDEVKKMIDSIGKG